MTDTLFCLQPGGYNREAQWCARRADVTTEPSRLAVPIGTVEWTIQYAARFGIEMPEWQTYPPSLSPWLGRSVWPELFCHVLPGQFCKPIHLKRFTGALREHVDKEVSPYEPVWISDPVAFTAEWRCYILQGQIVGWGQYGEGDDAEPNLAQVASMLAAWRGPAGWTLDVGRLADGRQVLVEANDGWALGYYKGCPPEQYLRVIAARWAELAGTEG